MWLCPWLGVDLDFVFILQETLSRSHMNIFCKLQSVGLFIKFDHEPLGDRD